MAILYHVKCYFSISFVIEINLILTSCSKRAPFQITVLQLSEIARLCVCKKAVKGGGSIADIKNYFLWILFWMYIMKPVLKISLFLEKSAGTLFRIKLYFNVYWEISIFFLKFQRKGIYWKFWFFNSIQCTTSELIKVFNI